MLGCKLLRSCGCKRVSGTIARQVKALHTSVLLSEAHGPLVRKTAEDVVIGDWCTFQKVVDENQVSKFAELTEDCNPIHLDENVAKLSRFKTRAPGDVRCNHHRKVKRVGNE